MTDQAKIEVSLITCFCCGSVHEMTVTQVTKGAVVGTSMTCKCGWRLKEWNPQGTSAYSFATVVGSYGD